MTKEKFIELIQELSEDAITSLCQGMNQITFEYGWGNDELDYSNLIKEIWKI